MIQQHDPLVRILDPLRVRTRRHPENQTRFPSRHLGLEAASVVSAVGVHFGQVFDGFVELFGGARHRSEDVAASEADSRQAQTGDDHRTRHAGGGE